MTGHKIDETVTRNKREAGYLKTMLGAFKYAKRKPDLFKIYAMGVIVQLVFIAAFGVVVCRELRDINPRAVQELRSKP